MLYWARRPVETPALRWGGQRKMDCIFCQIDRAILAESKLSLAFFDGFPVSKGQAIVIPRRHVATIWELSDEEYVGCLQSG